MFDAPEQWVPKVHPLTREAAPADPMELTATPARGDPEVMLQYILEEFAWMGMDAEELTRLCRHPNYPVLNQLWNYFGEAAVREWIDALAKRFGVVRVTEVVADEVDLDDEDESPLVELSIGKLRGERD